MNDSSNRRALDHHRKLIMECPAAQARLETLWPGDPAPSDPELAAAVHHARTCPHCGAEWERRARSDEAISRAMTEVPVPSDLQHRVLQALGVSGTAVPNNHAHDADNDALRTGLPNEQPATTPQPVVAPPAKQEQAVSERQGIRRRTALALAGLSAVVALLCWSFWPVAESTWSWQELVDRLPADISELPRFERSLQDALPQSGWLWSSLEVVGPPRALRMTDTEEPVGAVVGFRTRDRRQRTIEGLLLIVPASRVAPKPEQTYFSAAGHEYVSTSAGRYAAVAWQEGDYVYVCLVPGGAEALERLQESFELLPA